MNKTFVGFGFGPIQSGLFLYEAYRTGNFDRFVVVDVDKELVEALRRNNGTYYINIAKKDGIITARVDGVEIYDPGVNSDRAEIIDAISQSNEMCTALPSVRFYDMGNDTNVSLLIAEGLLKKSALKGDMKPSVIYAAENNNRAAEILTGKIKEKLSGKLNAQSGGKNKIALILNNFQSLNTVIGKMSGVIHDRATIKNLALKPFVPGIERAFLVEEFNRIYISKIRFRGFNRRIEVFMEKDNLLPFEEAKLYGHNAIHALIAYLGDVKGYKTIAEAGRDTWIMEKARRAFLEESGRALVKKYEELKEPLFTYDGYREYADDLLERMVNPNLHDSIERVGRDRPRKLGIEDRLYGTMRLALSYGIEPSNLALGAAAGLVSMLKRKDTGSRDDLFFLKKLIKTDAWRMLDREIIAKLLHEIWGRGKIVEEFGERLIDLTFNAYKILKEELKW